MGLAGSKTLCALGGAAIATLALLAGAVDAEAALSDQPQVAVDKDRNAYFTWRRFDGTDQVKTRKRNTDGSLTAVQDLSAAGRDANQPQVAVDLQGNAIFVWYRFNGSHNIIQTRKRNPNGTLSAVQDLSAPGGSAFSPQVAVDPQGNAYFVWNREGIIQTRRRATDGTLSGVQNLSPGVATEPQVAVDAAGNAYFVWRRFGTDEVIQFRRATSGTLGGVQTLSAAGEDAAEPQLAVGPNGNADFVWRRFAGTHTIIQTRRRSASGSIGAVLDLTGPEVSAILPQVAIDPQGNAIFTWDRGHVQTRRRPASGPLSDVQDLNAPTAGAGHPQVEVDSTGTASFVWDGFVGSDLLVSTRRRTAEGLLSEIQHLSTAGPALAEPQLGVDSRGNAIFVWRGGDIIKTRRRTPGGTLSAVQNVTG
jgi:hypothetical protein